MKKTVFNFPESNSITCIWIETGDPRHPLTRVWTDGHSNALPTIDTDVTDLKGLRRCA
jgi:hypothetical protein